MKIDQDTDRKEGFQRCLNARAVSAAGTAEVPTRTLIRSATSRADRGGQILRAVGDPVRWQIVQLLAQEQLCVCHLTEALEIAQPLVSHHVKVLREAGLIQGERFRYWTYYRLVPEVFGEIAELLAGMPTAAGRSKRRPCE